MVYKMKKYLFIAREKIIGINDDRGLFALDGIGKIIIDIPDDKRPEEYFDYAIEKVNEAFPDRYFESFEWKLVE